MNTHRTNLGLTAYTLDDTLNAVAKVRATEIAASWSHTRPDGRKFSTAFSDNGVKYSYIGENLACQFTDAGQVVYSWDQSPAHKASMEDKEFTKTGIYVYTDANGTMYVAQEFSK